MTYNAFSSIRLEQFEPQPMLLRELESFLHAWIHVPYAAHAV